MAVTLPVTPNRHNFTGVATSWTRLTPFTLPSSAQHLVVLLTMRAYAAAATRNMTVTWCGSPVTVKSTSLLGTITQQEDFHYWLGVIANPDVVSSPELAMTADGTIRGMFATLYFVDGADSTTPVIVHDFQDRASAGNTVTMNGTPARAGGIMVSATGLQSTLSPTVTSFTPVDWTVDYAGTSTNTAYQIINIARAPIASTAAVETITQWSTSDVNRGGVLFEIQATAGTEGALTESASPSDSVGTPVVAVSLGLTETSAAADSTTALIPANTTPENPVGVWTGATASWKLPSGADSKGGGNLTVSGLSAATIKGPGATFTAAAYARRTAPNLGTPGNFTFEGWVKSTTFGHLFYIGPRVSGTNIARVWVDANGAWNMLRTVGAATQSAKSANGAAVLGTSYHAAAVFASGQDHRLYVNGDPVSLAMTGSAVTGGIAIGSDDEIAIGDPTLASLAGFAGDMGRVTLWPIAMSASRVKASYRQQNDFAQWVGISGENAASDTNRAPAAVPMQEALTAGVAKTIDVIARAYDPDGDALSIQSGSLTPSTGAASIVSGRVSWTPAASFAGSATCGFTLRDGGGKTSASTIYGTVSAPPGPPGAFPRTPPAATATLRVPEDYATITAALDAAAPGNHISVANGTYREDITSSKSGSLAGGYIVIKARNHLGATLAGTTAGGVRSWKFTGSYIWVTGFVCNNPQEHSPNYYQGGKNSYYNSDRPEYQFRLAGSNLRVTNCRINSPCGVAIANGCNGIDVCYNTFTMSLAPRWSQANAVYMGHSPFNSAGASNVLVARNKWTGDAAVTHWVGNPSNPSDPTGDNDGRYCFYSGNNEPIDSPTGNNRTVRFVENFVEVTSVPTGWYFKRGYEVRRNFIRAKSSTNVAFNQRHGGYSRSDGTAFSDLDDSKRALIIGNNFDRGIFRLNDTDHLVVSNRMGGNGELYYGGRRVAGTSLANYNINPNPGWTQAASRTIFVGNTFAAQLRAGEDEAAGSNKWKVWGAAEDERWSTPQDRQHAQGDTIKGVKNYPAGVTGQPTDANGRFVRITNGLGEQTIENGTAGYQVFGDNDAGTWGSLLQPYVTRAELEFATGCDAP